MLINLFKDKKKRAILGIVFWILFVVIIMLFLRYESIKRQKVYDNNHKKYQVVVDYDELKNVLLKNKYEYRYIVIDDNMYMYDGVHEKSDDLLADDKYKYLNLENIFNLIDDPVFTKGTLDLEKNNIYVKIRVLIDNNIFIEIEDNNIIYQLKIYNIEGYQVKGSDE